jgi:hypothetical protein
MLTLREPHPCDIVAVPGGSGLGFGAVRGWASGRFGAGLRGGSGLGLEVLGVEVGLEGLGAGLEGAAAAA